MGGKVAIASIIAAISALTLAACSGGTASDTKGTETSMGNKSKEMPKIYIYQNTGALNEKPEGSVPEKLEEMKKMYMQKLGIEPIAIIPPQGADASKEG